MNTSWQEKSQDGIREREREKEFILAVVTPVAVKNQSKLNHSTCRLFVEE